MGVAVLDGKLMFPSEYVAAIEMQGRDATVTITRVEIQDLRMKDNSTQKKPILFFKETKKKLVLNKTNAGTIADALGSEARKWVGRQITLYPTRCQSFGNTVDCIRVRSKSSSPPVSPPPIDEEEAASIAEREAREAAE